MNDAYTRAHKALNKSSQSLKYYDKYNGKNSAITPIRNRKTDYDAS